jgi:phage terminase small subunit
MSPKPKPKSFMTPTATTELNRVEKLLKDRGLFDEIRRASLEAYAIAYGRFMDAEQQLSSETDPGKVAQLLAVSNMAQRKLRDHGRDLGLAIQVQPRSKPPAAPKADDARASMEQAERALEESCRREFSKH